MSSKDNMCGGNVRLRDISHLWHMHFLWTPIQTNCKKEKN